MSTISEIDIRDWDKIDIENARECIDNLDDYARMANIEYAGVAWMNQFLNQLEQLRNKQIKEATKNVAALFKSKENNV